MALTYMTRAHISADFAKSIGNPLYGIMLGLTLSSPIRGGRVFEWDTPVLVFYICLSAYFLADWITYNATIQLRSKMPHIHLIGYILAVIVLGTIIALIGSIDSIGTVASGPRILFIEISLLAYLIITTAVNEIFIERSYLDDGNGNTLTPAQRRVDRAELAVRSMAIVALFFFLLFRNDGIISGPAGGVPMDVVFWSYASAAALLGVMKLVRYDRTILPLIIDDDSDATSVAPQDNATTN